MSRPLIGLSVSEIRRVCETATNADAAHARQSEPHEAEVVLPLDYMRAVEMAGGVPVMLAPVSATSADTVLDHLSGLLLTGGGDIDPCCYGAERHAQLGSTHPAVDAFEISLCERAYRRGIPILGVCRGAQLLNVALHGTLHQHVPDFSAGIVEHHQRERGRDTTHRVRVAPDSTLARATGGGPVWVNSFHHQVIDRVGVDLRAVAWSDDGAIEAVEARGRHFVLGVQWHAEALVSDASQLALFERLIEAAAGVSPGAATLEEPTPPPPASSPPVRRDT